MAYDDTNYDVTYHLMSCTSCYDVTYPLVRYIKCDVTVLPLMSSLEPFISYMMTYVTSHMIFMLFNLIWLANLHWFNSIKTLHIIYAMLHSQAPTQIFQTFYAPMTLSLFPKSRGSVLHTAHTSPRWPFLVLGLLSWILRVGVFVLVGLAITDFELFNLFMFRFITLGIWNHVWYKHMTSYMI